ncbi:MAG: Fis family transcriptional regulator [Deltaproteobacteria bacterium]|nr:MAG: Fis family transcriptional regulator [Deltaproteobacteria bacterium]
MSKKEVFPEAANDIILDSISDGVFTVDHNWRIMSFNRAAEEITGTPKKEAIGRYCWEVFRSNMCEGGCALRKTMQEKKSFSSTSTYIIDNKQRRVPIGVSTALLRNEEGEVLGGVETFRDRSLVEELRRTIDSRYVMGDMVSRSEAMQKIFALLPQVAECDSTVLIEGETGTGKELLASALHANSARKDGPFIAINCGALPDTLLESELFGYKAGAFTGADRDKPGLFQAAGKGTIFLDEIGDISPAFQVRLLRVLEAREFVPVGGLKPEKTEARIIAATNRDLARLVEEGTFRRDLFYRINVLCLELPPLRERTEDIPLLVEHFIGKLNRLRERSIKGLSGKALATLMSHTFPGNIRELENIIEHGFVLCQGEEIENEHLPASLQELEARAGSLPRGHRQNMQMAEADLIIETLRRCNYNRLQAAKELGIHKSTLFRKIKKYQISLPDIDGRSRSPIE